VRILHSEMTYIVSSGELNSTHSLALCCRYSSWVQACRWSSADAALPKISNTRNVRYVPGF